MRRQSELNSEQRSRTTHAQRVQAHVTTAHNYSSQTLNSTELAKEKLRAQLAKVRVLLRNIMICHRNQNFTCPFSWGICTEFIVVVLLEFGAPFRLPRAQ